MKALKIRALCALLLAGLGIGLVFPLMPWAKTVHAWSWAPGWPVAPWLVAGGLATAALLLPKVPPRRQPWPRGRAITLGIGVLCLLQPLLHSLILYWAGWHVAPSTVEFVWPALPVERGAGFWLQMGLTMVILPSICEEWFFRGRLLPWLQGRVGTISAISLSSLWFTAVHGNILALFVALPMGIALGLLFHVSGRLYACMAVHACHNILLLSLGGILVARPDLALLLFAIGAWLVVSAFSQHLLSGKRQRLATIVVVLITVLGVHAAYRQLHQRLWLWSASRQLLQVPSIVLLPRLEHAQRHRVLTPVRSAALLAQLQTLPQPRQSEWWWLAACLDPDTTLKLAMAEENGAYRLLRHLAAYPRPHHLLQINAALASGQNPLALSALAHEDPTALALLLPLATYHDLLSQLLSHLEARPRASLYASCRLAFGLDAAAALYLEMNPERVGPRDVYALRRHHPQATALIEALASSDPERYRAWTLNNANQP